MTDEQTAAAIVAEHEMSSVNAKSMEAAIVRALQQARKAPPGHIIDDAGVVRRVNMVGFSWTHPDKPVPLPVYADGELWMMGELAYTIHEETIHEFYADEHNPAWTDSGWVIRWGEGEIELSKCYSTREAAEAAKEEKK